jgi:hypothetical protein
LSTNTKADEVSAPYLLHHAGSCIIREKVERRKKKRRNKNNKNKNNKNKNKQREDLVILLFCSFTILLF